MNTAFKNYLLDVTNATDCKEVEVIQSLWSGYGKIARYQLFEADLNTVIIKHIDLSAGNKHPRGWNTNRSHLRKLRSYEVETNWYKHWNQRCTSLCRTADYLGSMTSGKEQWIILEDLDAEFSERKHHLEFEEVNVCLSWLANFHATFLGEQPDGLWETGTYWHLATRPEEFERMENSRLKQKAHRIDELVNSCLYKTIVHGDAKVANFCFSTNSQNVAAVDFQYVGGGCGMKDVAYFLGSCLTSSECEHHAESLLDFYFTELQKAVSRSKPNVDFDELEQEWRRMYPIAWTDFTRFLEGWMPTHDKLNEYSNKLMESVLMSLD